MIRFCDFIFSAIGCIVLLPAMILLYVIGLLDTGKPLFRQQRVGKGQKSFTLIKFRTMRSDTPEVATHLANKSAVTRYGRFLRRTKLDELPQLLNVLVGDMSLVGARPNLFNQRELIREREQRGIYNYTPGITGLSQIKGIDMSTPKLLAETDKIMYDNFSLTNYFRYIMVTVIGKGRGDRIRQ